MLLEEKEVEEEGERQGDDAGQRARNEAGEGIANPAKGGRKGVEEEWEGRIPTESSPRRLGKRVE